MVALGVYAAKDPSPRDFWMNSFVPVLLHTTSHDGTRVSVRGGRGEDSHVADRQCGLPGAHPRV